MAAMLATTMLLTTGGCTPDFKGEDLGPLPQADFEVLPGSDANTVVLVNKTNMKSIPHWFIPPADHIIGDSALVRLVFAATYDIKMIAAGRGGMDSITKPVTISQSDPDACSADKLLGFLAGCTSKTWKLNPEAGAYKVGGGPGMGDWWASGIGDVTGRACEFNDEYTFGFNPDYTFNFDNKGDYYADGYIGAGTFGCEPNSNLTGSQAAWASGNFSYVVIEGAGVNGLGQVRVNGTGAHIGLQKAYNGGESTAGPVGSSITYDVLEMHHDVGGQGYDILVLGVSIGAGWWTFTLRSF